MGNKMFCFQCEQTAGCTGCMGNAGVCGKTADVAQLQDELTGALIGLARATDNAPDVNDGTWRLMIEGLFTTVTNVSFNEKTLRELIDRVHAEKARLVPDCSDCAAPCGRAADYDMARLWNAQEDIRSLKSLILFGVRGMAAYAHHALVLGYTDDAVNDFFAKALFAVGEDWGMEELLPIVMEVGEKNLKCMALLDKANTESYGTPAPATVPLTVEKGPFIDRNAPRGIREVHGQADAREIVLVHQHIGQRIIDKFSEKLVFVKVFTLNDHKIVLIIHKNSPLTDFLCGKIIINTVAGFVP